MSKGYRRLGKGGSTEAETSSMEIVGLKLDIKRFFKRQKYIKTLNENGKWKKIIADDFQQLQKLSNNYKN